MQLLPNTQLAEICQRLDQDANIHRFELAPAMQHFAYLVPFPFYFTERQLEAALDYIGASKEYRTTALQAAKNQVVIVGGAGNTGPGYLESEYVPPHGFVYRMIRQRRVAYQNALPKPKSEPEPELKDVSQKLQELIAKISDPEQRAFVDEALRCLQVQACRSAIVMGWNLTYDHFKRWILSKHLPAFNAELALRNKHGNPLHDPVNRYEDFPEKESLVLAVAYKAVPGLDKNIFQKLEEGLKKRNHYAHPNKMVATAPIAAGHIADLLEHVVLNSFFAL